MKPKKNLFRALLTSLGIAPVLLACSDVRAQSGGSLIVQPQHLVFNAVAGQSSTTVQRLRVVSANSAQIGWSSTASQTWITSSATTGTTPGSQDISVDALSISAPGIYQGEIRVSVNGSSEPPQIARVTLIINSNVGPRPATWRDGRKGACSISVDDSLPAGFEVLQQTGLKGTYFLNGSAAADFFSGFYQAGMEMASHMLNHFCHELNENDLRGNIEPNIAGISYSTQMPLQEFIGLAWPCGFYTLPEQVIASEYYLSARGYGSNQLEDPTPTDFMNLKSFNSHEHNYPQDDRDLKDAVDAAETAGKWVNLVFHAELNDDGAVEHTLTKDLWVAPIGAVVKYIHQRDRVVISGYSKTDSSIQFMFRRLPLDLPRRFPGDPNLSTFETAVQPEDTVTLELDLNSIPDFQGGVLQILVDGIDQPYIIRTDGAKRRLLMNVQASPVDQAVVMVLSPDPTPALGPLPANLVFAALEGTDPAEQVVQIANIGSGTLDWTATVANIESPWLEVTPTDGVGNGTLTARVNTAGLLPGIHTGAIIVEAIGAANSPQGIEVNLTVIEAGTQHFDFTYPDRNSMLNSTGWSFDARTASGQPRPTEASGNLAVSYNQSLHPGVIRIPAASGQFWAGDNNSVNTLFRDLPPDWTSIRVKASFHPSPAYVNGPLALQYHQVGLVAYRDDDNYISITRILNKDMPPHETDVGFLTYYVHNQVEVIEESGQVPMVAQFAPFPTASFFLRLDRYDANTLGGLYSVDGETWLELPTEISHNLEGPQFIEPLRLGVFVGGAYPLHPSPPVDLHWVEVIRTPPVHTLRIGSLNPASGVTILVSRPDQTGAADGLTEFTRSYYRGTQVKLTATAVAGSNFQQWRKNGLDIGSNPNVQVTVDGDHTLTAVYAAVPIVRRLTVNSTPDSAINMTVSPVDNGGASSGSTQFTLSYNNGTSVTVTAPTTTTSGKIFEKWNKDGQDMGSNPAVQVTMDADHTLTAIYSTPAVVRTLTVESANPDSGVDVAVSPADNDHSAHGSTKFTRSYNDGTIVTLTAPPTVGANSFQKWQKDGQDYSFSATAQVTMDGDHSLKAIYATPSLWTLNVTSSNPDRFVLITVEPADSDGDRAGITPFHRSYKNGTLVTLKAPATYFGRSFQKWQKDGQDSGTSPTLQVIMDGHHTLMAVYIATPIVRTLTVASSNPDSGVGMTLSPADNSGKRTGSTKFTLAYNHGTVVKITAPATVEGNSFQKWQKDGKDFSKDTSVDVSMDDNHTLTAIYLAPPSRTLTVASANPNSGVAVAVSLADNHGKRDGSTKFTRTYKNGSVVTLTAPVTASGNTFQKWQKNGVDAGNSPNVQLTLDADYTMTAIYVTPQLLRTLTVASSNPGSGVAIKVSPKDDNGKRDGSTLFTRSYKKDTTVTLKAPSSMDGNHFQKWVKDGLDFATSATVKVTMDANHTLTAVYVTPRVIRTLTVTSSKPGGGVDVTVSPADINGKGNGSTKFTRTYDKWTTVTLQAAAIASNKNVFQKWQKDGKDFATSAIIQVTMDADHTLNAIYGTPPEPVLPNPWGTQDIGNVGEKGGASYSGSTFTLRGSGNDIWNTADEFRYAFQLKTGDYSLVARVNSVENTDPWAKAGVMIRESLNANSKHASVFVTPGNGVAFQSRSSAGGNSQNVNKTGLTAPVWVKITRAGSTFTGSYSLNGVQWTTLGSQSIPMGSEVYIGLAVTSHDDDDVCTTLIDNVTSAHQPANTPPAISNIPDQVTVVNQAKPGIPFTITDAETAGANLILSGSSSNTGLVPNANITFGGSGNARTVTIQPAAHKTGTSSITITVTDGDKITTDTFVLTVNSVIAGRHLFYNRSAFDGNNADANASDDAAIATDKVPLFAGQKARFVNYSSYSQGINGIMVDIAGLPGTPTASDFRFKVGNNNTPSAWATAPTPSTIVVRRGAGVNGSDRITLIWTDNRIQKQWLEITVLGTSNTGLATPSVFYFGNAIADAGDSATDAKVTPADQLLARSNQRSVFNPAPIDFPYDFNRDKAVNVADQLIARANQTTVFSALRLLDLSALIASTP